MRMGHERENRAGRKAFRRPIITCVLLVALLLIITQVHAVDDPFRPLLDAMYQHESVSGTILVGDGGRSRGDYHICRDYWTDGIEQLRREGFDYIADGLEDYLANVYDRWASEVIMKAVWRRYELAGYRAVNFEICARLHNGSRRWREYASTARYWEDVRVLIRNGED